MAEYVVKTTRHRISHPSSTERQERWFWKPRRPRHAAIRQHRSQRPSQVPKCNEPTTFKDEVVGIKVVDSLDIFLHLCHGETPPLADTQSADQQSVDLIGNGRDGSEEAGGVLEVGAEGEVAKGGGLPRVTTGKRVEENNAEGPDIVEQGECEPLWENCPPWHSESGARFRKV